MEQRKTFGVLRDIKNGEFRVVLTPAQVLPVWPCR